MDINDFFTHIIDGYLLHDLKNMDTVKQKKGEPAGAIGYPMLATTASGIELLGSILQQSGSYKDDAASSSGYFKHFWTEYLVPVDVRYKDKDDIFWKLVRHGVAHTYFTKVGITVTKRKPSKHLLATPSGLNIDCSTFYKHFLKAYTKLVKKNLKNRKFADQVQINIDKLFELSGGKAENFSDVIFSRESDFTPLSATKSEQNATTTTVIPADVLKSMRNKISLNTAKASGASLAQPIGNIEIIRTQKKLPNQD